MHVARLFPPHPRRLLRRRGVRGCQFHQLLPRRFVRTIFCLQREEDVQCE